MFTDNLFNNKFLIRDVEAEDLLESFLVSAVVSVLAIRFFLAVTDYPKLGGETLQIAHLLWGGFFMLIALIIFMAFLNKPAHRIAVVIGGLGFGAFIDELGKFVTQDNNYFFQPAVAIIYLVFVLLYLFSQSIKKWKKLTEHEYLINTIEILKGAIYNDLHGYEKKRAAELLKKADPKDPMIKSIRAMLRKAEAIPSRPGLFTKTTHFLRRLYKMLIAQKWFSGAIIAFFVFQAISSLWRATAVVEGFRILVISAIVGVFFAIKIFRSKALRYKVLYAGIFFVAVVSLWTSLSLKFPVLSIIGWGELASSALAGAFVVAGIWLIKSSRVEAYRMFKRAVLVSIFLTQFFSFYQQQFAALLGLAGNILILITLRYVIAEEESINKKEHKN